MSSSRPHLPSLLSSLLIAVIAVALALLLGVVSPTFGGLLSPQVSTTGFRSPKVGPSTGGGATCVSGYVAISANATNTRLLLDPPVNAMATTELSVEMLEPRGTIMQTINGGPAPVAGTFQIFSKLCFPNNITGTSSTVQFLSHGGTLDHNYWDIAPNYSYVDIAAAAGYATFSYDRLGVGLSDHPDPIQVVQAQIQVQIAHNLVQLLRGAKLCGHSFKHVVGIGHSAGSAISQGVTTQYPKDFDAVILTGTSTSLESLNMATASFDIIPARDDPSGRFAGLSTGYQTQGPIPQAIQAAFYRYPFFDPKIFKQQFDARQTNTLGELFTLGSVFAPSTQFTGPVDVVIGKEDFVFCGGDCANPTDQSAAVIQVFYPAAGKGSQHFLVPDCGHVIEAHLNGKQGSDQMINFIKANGFV